MQKFLKKILRPGTLSLIITNKEMKDIKKVKPLNNSDLLKKNFTKRTKNDPAGKYWSPGRPEDVPLQRPQDVP